MSCPTLKESAANRQLGPPLPIECKRGPRPPNQESLLVKIGLPQADEQLNCFHKIYFRRMEILFTGDELCARCILQILPQVLNLHEYYKEQLVIPILYLQKLRLRVVKKLI